MFDTAVAGVAFPLGRVLFGAVLAFIGLNHFLNAAPLAGYAEFKCTPLPGLVVPFRGGMVLAGSLTFVFGAYPVVGADALALFLLAATPRMRDCWAATDEDRQDELIVFLENDAVLGGSLEFLSLGSGDWPSAVNVGLI